MESKKGAPSAHILYTRMDSNNPICKQHLLNLKSYSTFSTTRTDPKWYTKSTLVGYYFCPIVSHVAEQIQIWIFGSRYVSSGCRCLEQKCCRFFVISGYLIFMLLSRKRPIDASKTWDFYFRRVKRIVPIYLFIVATTLFAILHLLSPIEFTQVVDESIPALAFYSNMPSSRPFKYFDISSKLYFFLHTW